MYRLLGRLEQGELADLLRAEDTASGGRVVIKLFHERTTDIGYAREIARIATALAPLSDRRIARVLEVGLLEGKLAIVRQDVGSTTLGLALQRLNTREVVLPPALAIVLVLQVVEALAAAHALGVVHGALTPGNVLLDDAGLPSVAEFGALAALQASEALAAFIGRGRTAYRAPELKSASSQATPQADLYAVAAIAYELLTLREASTGSAAVSTRVARVPPPSRLVRRLNSRIDPVIMRALEQTPARRHKSLTEFADGLRDFLAAQGAMPPLSDLAKFLSELFPNEVRAAPLAPPPFEAPFALTPLGESGPIARPTQEVGPRPPFSGGAVDEATPTSDGLPVFSDEQLEQARAGAKTETEVPQLPERRPAAADWVAPAGPIAEPLPPTASPPGGEGLRRLKQLEALDVSDGQPSQLPPPKKKEARKTVKTFALGFRREGEPLPVDYDALRARARFHARLASVLGTLALLGTTFGFTWWWYRSSPDPYREAISYLPAPLERALWRPPPPPQMVPGVNTPRVVLPDYDHQPPPPPHHHKDGVEPAPGPPPVVTPVRPAPKRADCYAPPRGKAGVLSVLGQNLKVEIDGVAVCGATGKILLEPGSHSVTVIDLGSRKHATSTVVAEAGKAVKIAPPGRTP